MEGQVSGLMEQLFGTSKLRHFTYKLQQSLHRRDLFVNNISAKGIT